MNAVLLLRWQPCEGSESVDSALRDRVLGTPAFCVPEIPAPRIGGLVDRTLGSGVAGRVWTAWERPHGSLVSREHLAYSVGGVRDSWGVAG
jgi:hypothetical protein